MGAKAWISAPPVESDLLRLVDGANQKANLNGKELDVGKIDLDVTNDNKTFVEHTVEHVDEAVTP